MKDRDWVVDACVLRYVALLGNLGKAMEGVDLAHQHTFP